MQLSMVGVGRILGGTRSSFSIGVGLCFAVGDDVVARVKVDVDGAVIVS